MSILTGFRCLHNNSPRDNQSDILICDGDCSNKHRNHYEYRDINFYHVSRLTRLQKLCGTDIGSTPAPVTAYSGIVRTTTTVTAPTPTRTRTSRVYVTTWTTSTIVATYVLYENADHANKLTIDRITSTVKTTPSGMVCATKPGGW